MLFVVTIHYIQTDPWLGIEWQSDRDTGLVVNRVFNNSSGELTPGTRILAFHDSNNLEIALNSASLHASLEYLNSYDSFNRHVEFIQAISEASVSGEITLVDSVGKTIAWKLDLI